MERSKPAFQRRAIYTRESSEEGLEQEFNSVHAQREAFIKSQAGEGWRLIKTAYDDGASAVRRPSVSSGRLAKAQNVDPALLKAVARAHRWFDELVTGRVSSMVEIGKR